jgi:hypothetical protein
MPCLEQKERYGNGAYYRNNIFAVSIVRSFQSKSGHINEAISFFEISSK